jgi:hypothetical protein
VAASCSWSSTISCTGSSPNCDAYWSASTCQANPGCSWGTYDAPCSGTVTPCSQLSVADCPKQPGCTVSTL